MSRTAGQPGLVSTSAASPPSTTTVDTAAIGWPRRARCRLAASRAARRSTVTASALTRGMLPARPAAAARSRPDQLQDGRLGGLAHPASLDLAELARGAKAVDRLRDAARERRVLVQQRAPLVAARGAELADDRRVRDLRRGQVEGGGQVHHHRVHLALLERGDHVVGVVEDLRLARRLDLGVHRVQARGPDLDADRRVLEVGERGRAGRGGALRGDHGLVGRVVGRGEVDVLLARRRDRDLVDVEVEVLGARGVGGVEGLRHPVDLRALEAELIRDRVGDRALEPLAVGRIVVLEVGRVGRLVGGHGQLPLGVGLELAGLAVGRRRRRCWNRSRSCRSRRAAPRASSGDGGGDGGGRRIESARGGVRRVILCDSAPGARSRVGLALGREAHGEVRDVDRSPGSSRPGSRASRVPSSSSWTVWPGGEAVAVAVQLEGDLPGLVRLQAVDAAADQPLGVRPGRDVPEPRVDLAELARGGDVGRDRREPEHREGLRRPCAGRWRRWTRWSSRSSCRSRVVPAIGSNACATERVATGRGERLGGRRRRT